MTDCKWCGKSNRSSWVIYCSTDCRYFARIDDLTRRYISYPPGHDQDNNRQLIVDLIYQDVLEYAAKKDSKIIVPMKNGIPIKSLFDAAMFPYKDKAMSEFKRNYLHGFNQEVK